LKNDRIMKAKFKPSILKRAIVSAIAIWATILCTQLHADTDTSVMSVSVRVKHSCSIDTNPMTFRAYNGAVTNASSALDATATLISLCTSGTAALITMNAGTFVGSGSDVAPVRRMTSGGGDYLVYQVYSDASRETIWGNTTSTGVALTGTGSTQTLTVYGSIPSAQMVPAGDYSDHIIVTITY